MNAEVGKKLDESMFSPGQPLSAVVGRSSRDGLRFAFDSGGYAAGWLISFVPYLLSSDSNSFIPEPKKGNVNLYGQRAWQHQSTLYKVGDFVGRVFIACSFLWLLAAIVNSPVDVLTRKSPKVSAKEICIGFEKLDQLTDDKFNALLGKIQKEYEGKANKSKGSHESAALLRGVCGPWVIEPDRQEKAQQLQRFMQTSSHNQGKRLHGIIAKQLQTLAHSTVEVPTPTVASAATNQ